VQLGSTIVLVNGKHHERLGVGTGVGFENGNAPVNGESPTYLVKLVVTPVASA
jgi:hypothetical protein